MAIIIIIIITTTPPLAVGSDQLAGQARVEEHQQGERAEVDDQTVEDVLVDDLVAHHTHTHTHAPLTALFPGLPR